jgi:hypothetical protein
VDGELSHVGIILAAKAPSQPNAPIFAIFGCLLLQFVPVDYFTTDVTLLLLPILESGSPPFAIG